MSDTTIYDDTPNHSRLPSSAGWGINDPDATNVHVQADGSVYVDGAESEDEEPEDPTPAYLRHDFDENLAEHMLGHQLATLAMDIQRGIDADRADRKDWEQTAAAAIEWLGIQIGDEMGSDAADATTLSNIWAPLLMESVTKFWANASAEFLPAGGPAKVRDDKPPNPIGMGHNGGPPMQPDVPSRSELAQAFELDLNHYLTVTDRAYYRDFSRMLLSLGLTGTQFRKVFWCPLKGRPVSEWVKAQDLIVSSDASDLSTAARVTQVMKYSQANVLRMQKSGWWRDVSLNTPFEMPTDIERAEQAAEGVTRNPQEPGDQRHEIEECYLEIDLPGFEHTDEDGEPDGIPLPYRVTLDKDSRHVLEVRRNWRDGDPLFQPRQRFVMFGLIPGLKFYYLGFAHLLGQGQLMLTSIMRQLIDAGCFSNFPGFLIAKGMSRQTTSDFMVEPGQGKEIDTMGKDIRTAVMNLPYKGADQTLAALATELTGALKELAGVANAPVGEGTADVPVGTVIAMIDQATKVTTAVHKGVHASRAEELELLRELIAEDPSVLSRFNKKAKRQWEQAEEFQDLDLVPSSDPNVPSQLHRIMQAWALVQMAQAMPGLFDPKWVASNALRTIGFEVPDEAFAQAPQGPPVGPPPDPAKMAMAQAMQQKNQILAQDLQRKAAEAVTQSENDRQTAALTAQTKAMELAGKQKIAETQQRTEQFRAAADGVKMAHEASIAEREHQLKASQPLGGAGIIGGGTGAGP